MKHNLYVPNCDVPKHDVVSVKLLIMDCSKREFVWYQSFNNFKDNWYSTWTLEFYFKIIYLPLSHVDHVLLLGKLYNYLQTAMRVCVFQIYFIFSLINYWLNITNFLLLLHANNIFKGYFCWFYIEIPLLNKKAEISQSVYNVYLFLV